MLRRSPKLQWGLGHKSLKIIYEGAIVPLITYGAPVWEQAIRKRKNLRKLQRVQRIINIKIAKAYRTLSYEASCVMAGVLPIEIVLEEKIQLYEIKHNLRERHRNCDLPLPIKEWPHPAQQVAICEVNDSTSYSIEIFMDGSKIRGRVGAGVAIIYEDKILTRTCKYKLDNDCSNNQAEQVAILKALESIQTFITRNPTKEIAIYTDSKVALNSIKNNSIHSHLNEKIRDKLRECSALSYKIHFGWVTAHYRHRGKRTGRPTRQGSCRR